jgi:Uma2 family endonuclease
MEATVHVRPVINLDDEQFYELCQLNRDLRMERNAQGDVVIMPPVGGETSDQNAEITMQLRLWAKRDARGTTFDSSGGFLLPNGTVRSPDASWIEKARLEALDAEERQRFIPLCPSFVIELRSPTDRLRHLQEKMQEYLDNGTRLGWLIDPQEKRVHVYRPHLPAAVVDGPSQIAGDPVLPGFVLDLSEIWRLS